MKRSGLLLALGLASLLGLVIAGLSSKLFRSLPPSASLEWRSPPVVRVSSEIRDALSDLDEKVQLSYWVSNVDALPSHLRGLEEEVTRVLRELERQSGGRIQVSLRDPEDHPEARDLLAARGLRPFRSRQLVQDGWVEKSLWSSLWIESGAAEGVLLQPILNQQLPELAQLIGEEVLRLQDGTPPAPLSVAVVSNSEEAPTKLLAQIADHGAKAQWFESADQVPAAIDALWLLNSSDAALETSRANEFLGSGRDVLIAISKSAPGASAADLLAAFGAYIEEGVLRSEGRSDLSSIAPNQDFRSYPFQPNGTLRFGEANALLFSSERLSELQRSLQPLAWTSATSQLVLPDSSVRSAPRRPLLSLLQPQDDRAGRLVIASSTELFADEVLSAEDPAHRNLVRLFLSPETGRLALSRIRSKRSTALPVLTVFERTFWRSLCVFLTPLLLAAAALWRGRKKWFSGNPTTRRTWRIAIASLALALLAAGGLSAAMSTALPRAWRADTTRSQSHHVTPAERELLSRCTSNLELRSGPLRLELLSSPDSLLSADLKARKRDLRELLEDWQLVIHEEDTFTDWELTAIDPEADWTAEERASARALGPLAREQAVDGVDGRTQSAAVTELWCGLILRSGERATTVSLLEEGGSLRFRLAFALRRLALDESVDVAFAADRSLLSSAEALLDYSERGLFPPTAGDTTSALRSAITAAGFTLRELDTQGTREELEEDCAGANALLWLQPRRDIGAMLQVTADHLSRGGKAMILAQHHEIEARQLGRDGLQFQFWPRPLKTDLDRFYLPQLGIDLSPELYFDANAIALPLPTRVEAGSGEGQARELQLGVQPFMVKSSAPGLGDLALPSSARIRFRPAENSPYKIRMTSLLTGSPSWWSHDWKGGNLQPDLLQKQAGLPDSEPNERQVLAALFEGAFPRAIPIDDGWRASKEAGSSSGRLLLVGNSLFLRDSLLATEAGALGAEFLIDSLARLTLPPDLAELNRRRNVPPSFEPLPSSTRRRARILVLGLGPALLALFAGLRALRSVKAH